MKSSEEVDFFDISIWRRSARLSPTTRRRATVLRDQRQLRGHPPELRHGTDTARRRRRGERGGVHGERPVHGPTDHAQRLGVRNSSYVSSLASASLASRTRVNKEPTSGLESLTCSLRVISRALLGVVGGCNLVYLSQSLFSGLPRVAPYCVPGGVRVVSTRAGHNRRFIFARRARRDGLPTSDGAHTRLLQALF